MATFFQQFNEALPLNLQMEKKFKEYIHKLLFDRSFSIPNRENLTYKVVKMIKDVLIKLTIQTGGNVGRLILLNKLY